MNSDKQPKAPKQWGDQSSRGSEVQGESELPDTQASIRSQASKALMANNSKAIQKLKSAIKVLEREIAIQKSKGNNTSASSAKIELQQKKAELARLQNQN